MHVKKRRSAGAGERNVRVHLRPAFGKIPAAKLTTDHVESFIDAKIRAGYEHASINRYLASLKRAFTLGIERDPPLVRAMPKFEMLDESDNVREGFLEHEDYLALLAELPSHLGSLLVLGYHFGMRSGELRSLRWDQVDWDANLIRLERKQTKSKQARNAPLYGDLRAWIEHIYAARDERSRYIIAFRGEQIESAKTAWKRATKRAGLEGLHIHDLRRTAIRNMMRAGISEKRAMSISGHKTANVFRRYDITDERDAHEDGEKLAAFFAKRAELAKVRAKFVQSPGTPSDGVPVKPLLIS